MPNLNVMPLCILSSHIVLRVFILERIIPIHNQIISSFCNSQAYGEGMNIDCFDCQIR